MQAARREVLIIGLANSLAQLFDGEAQGQRKAIGLKRLTLQLSVVLAYCGAAALSGLVLRAFDRDALGWLPAAMLACVTAASFAWTHQTALNNA